MSFITNLVTCIRVKFAMLICEYFVFSIKGLDDEAKVGFHEHVFLEPHLDKFPKKGPIRHFMELVAIGLSKNPYFTAQEKREHIEWYAEYFKDKYHLIEEEAPAALDTEQKKEIADSDFAEEGKKQCVE